MMETSFRKNLHEKFSNAIKADIIIPTLNEESSIRQIIHSIRSHSFPIKVSILVIDGGSIDKTVEICKEEKVQIIKQKGKGKGTAMREAVNVSNADIIIFMDGDGTYYVEDLEKLLEPLLNEKADMVVGSRLMGKREKGSISRMNTLGNKLFNRTINFAMNSRVTDSLSGYRAMRIETFRDLVLFSSNFEIEVEMTVEALAKGYRVLEVPIRYGNRKDSNTKLDTKADGIKIARTLLFISMNVNPIKFFGIITIGFIVLGSYPAAQVIFEKITLGEIVSIPSVTLAALLYVTGALSFVVGLVSELVVRSRRRLEYLISRKS